MTREEFAKKWGHERTMNTMGLPVTIPKYDEFLADLDSLSLPPAEGARKVQWSGYGELGNISQKPPQPPAEGAEEILANLEAYYDFKFHWIEKDRIIRAMTEFATLHAQRLAEKMVEEKMREELIEFGDYFNECVSKTIYTSLIDEYLKSRER